MEEQFTQTVVNVNTGKIEIIDLTEEQIKYALETRKIAEKLIAEEQAEAEVKAAEKAALLNRLGITEEEAKLLLS